MEHDPAVRHVLDTDAELKELATERWKNAAEANQRCELDISCKVAALVLDDAEIEKAAAALRRLYTQSDVIRTFVHTLKPFEEFSLDASGDEEKIFSDAWVHSARDLNQTISVYTGVLAPRYAAIDAMTYAAGSKSYQELMTIVLGGLALPEHSDDAPDRTGLFFMPALRFAVRLLQANNRDEAGRFWPVETGENAKPIARARSIRWNDYAYAAILVPGAGSEIPGIALSPWGRERLRLAVADFRAHKAPFLLVSGGFVHPSQTTYCEALEMKRYLVEVYGIDPGAIFVDPYARHTTTNLRNAAREAITYKLSLTKPMLIVSDRAQTDYISSPTFAYRNLEELDYQPMRLGRRLSATELEATPLLQSLYVDAADPLDP